MAVQPVPDKFSLRLLSLDVFRGVTVAAMILVNNPGDLGNIYAPLEHSEWNGCTPTDLIFPFFLFIVGVSIAYSLGSKKEIGTDQSALIKGILRRSLIIFGLGFLLALLPMVLIDPSEAFRTARIPGVLQRIALVYCFTALIFLKTSPKTQFGLLIFLLILYWVLMMLVPVPDTGYSSLEKETNLGAWLDRFVFTSPHLWKESITWDPEGLLGTIASIATALFGVLIGSLLKRKDLDDNVKLSWMLGSGVVAVIVGLLWSFEFPINKALWTSSYVLYTGGLASMTLAVCYWLIDVKLYRAWTKPFVVYGVNAIAVYFFSAIIAKTLNYVQVEDTTGKMISAKTWIYQNFFAAHFAPLNASVIYAICFVLFWQVILWWMYNKKIIIKV